MRIGVVTIDLRLHGLNSLKEKRAIMQSLLKRIRKDFNVSIMEINCLNDKRAAKLGAALVSNDGRLNNSMLAKLVKAIERHQGITVEDWQIEIL